MKTRPSVRDLAVWLVLGAFCWGLAQGSLLAVSNCEVCGTHTQSNPPPGANGCSCSSYTIPNCHNTSEMRVCAYAGTKTCACRNSDGSTCTWTCYTCSDWSEDCLIDS